MSIASHSRSVSSRISCLLIVFAIACGDENVPEEQRCRPTADGVLVLDGKAEIEQARTLVNVDGDLIVCNFSGEVSLPSLQSVEGALRFFTTWEGTVNLPSLVRTGGEIQSSINLSMPLLEESARISLSGFATGTLSLPSLTRLGHLWRQGPIDAPELLAANMITSGPMYAPKLRRFNQATFVPLGDSELPSLDNFVSATFDLSQTTGTLTLPSIREVGGLRFLSTTEQSFPERIQMPGLHTASHLAFIGPAELASVDFPLLTSLDTMDVIRVSGPAYCELKALADETGAIMNSNPDEPCN